MGKDVRPINRNSVRSSPTPSAPASSAAAVCPTPPILAYSAYLWPRALTAGPARYACSASACLFSSSCFFRYRTSSAPLGDTITAPCPPSTTTSSPLRSTDAAPAAPSTAGRPSARARMAAWLVMPPHSATKAATFSRFTLTVMEGVRSHATSTVPGGTSGMDASLRPSKIASRRARISSMSAARCASNSSPAAANSWMYDAHTASKAASAHSPASMRLSVCASRAGSFAIRIWLARMSASCPSRRARSASAIACVRCANACTAVRRRAFSCCTPAKWTCV